MSLVDETTIRLPVTLRDQIRSEAAAHGVRQADLLRLALRELEQAEFLRTVATTIWDDETIMGAQEWQDASLTDLADPWEPTS